MTGEGRPDEREIRRALAECMTVGDIDDAMGWSPGTARRRRWRPLADRGLPAADAELGGVALWFRATWENWQRAGFARHDPDGLTSPTAAESQLDPDPGTTGADHADDDLTEVGDAVELTDLLDEAHTAAADVDVEPAGDRPAATGIDHDEATEPEPGGTHGAGGEAGGAVDDNGGVVSVDDDIDAVNEAGQGEEPEEDGGGDAEIEPPPVTSGFEFGVDQQVLAFAHGRWREARVRHRDRATVVVEYNLDATPLGARRQRVGIDRVRPAAPDS